MDDVVNRGVPFANENVELNGRPAKNEFGSWSSEVAGTLHNTSDDISKLSPEEREKRLREMEEIVKKDLE